MSDMGCTRARELFSDRADGSLGELLSAELEAHLAGCADCAELLSAFEEAVDALRSHPLLEPSADLADRVAARSLESARQQPRRASTATSAGAWPRAFRIAAAVALLLSGGVLLASGPNEAAARTARRFSDKAGNAVAYLAEHKDRVVEDVRILRVVIAAAFEGRLDRVNDRFDDYRRLIERRTPAPQERDPKKSRNKESNSAHADLVSRCEAWKERART